VKQKRSTLLKTQLLIQQRYSIEPFENPVWTANVCLVPQVELKSVLGKSCLSQMKIAETKKDCPSFHYCRER